MNNFHSTTRTLLLSAFCFGVFACTSTPEVDNRPQLVLTAEKSLEMGVSNYTENNFAKAEAHFDRALFIYRNIDNPNGIITSCLNIAKTKLSAGQIEEARAYTEQAQSIINREQLADYDDRLTLIQTSIAIEDGNFNVAQQMLDDLLADKTTKKRTLINIATLQNRTRIAFLTNANDTDTWVKQYRKALKDAGQDTGINKARLLRFEAALNPDTTNEKLSRALSLYRNAAHSPGIAATLSEWASYDGTLSAYESAVEKLHRALFIRTHLHDRKNSQKILRQLATGYSHLGGTGKAERATYWQDKLDSKTFEQWDTVRFEFEQYPR